MTKRRRTRRGLVDMTLRPAPPKRPAPPYVEDRDRVSAWCPLPGWDLQVFRRIVRVERTGELAIFAVGLQAKPRGRDTTWQDVVRVDNSHQPAVHVDLYRRDGKKTKDFEIVPQLCRKNLESALKWGLAFIWDTEERISEWV